MLPLSSPSISYAYYLHRLTQNQTHTFLSHLSASVPHLSALSLLFLVLSFCWRPRSPPCLRNNFSLLCPLLLVFPSSTTSLFSLKAQKQQQQQQQKKKIPPPASVAHSCHATYIPVISGIFVSCFTIRFNTTFSWFEKNKKSCLDNSK